MSHFPSQASGASRSLGLSGVHIQLQVRRESRELNVLKSARRFESVKVPQNLGTMPYLTHTPIRKWPDGHPFSSGGTYRGFTSLPIVPEMPGVANCQPDISTGTPLAG